MKTVTKVIPNIEYNTLGQPVGPSKRLRLEVESANAAIRPYVAEQVYMEMVEQAKCELATDYEIAPLGRKDDEYGRWLWESFEGPLAEGFNNFLARTRTNITASFGCPAQFFSHAWKSEMLKMPDCILQFDDLGSHGPKLVNRLVKYMPEQLVVLETVPTDNISFPRLASVFNIPKRSSPNITYRVRADIVTDWLTKYPQDNPLFNLEEQVNLSLYLPARDCATFTVDMLRSVLHHFTNVTFQGYLPTSYCSALTDWKNA